MQDIKTLAKTLRASLQQSGHDVPHVTALKAVANLAGHPNYQTLLAMRSQSATDTTLRAALDALIAAGTVEVGGRAIPPGKDGCATGQALLQAFEDARAVIAKAPAQTADDEEIRNARIAPQCPFQADLLIAVRDAIPHLQGAVRSKLTKAFHAMREQVVLTAWGIDDFDEEVIQTTTESERRIALIDFYRNYDTQERDWTRLSNCIEAVVDERKTGGMILRVRLDEDGTRSIDLDATEVYKAVQDDGEDLYDAIRDIGKLSPEEEIFDLEVIEMTA